MRGNGEDWIRNNASDDDDDDDDDVTGINFNYRINPLFSIINHTPEYCTRNSL